MIESLDTYMYTRWKKYNSHYATILNWIRRDWNIKKIKQLYTCKYNVQHEIWKECNC
jgi:hypothetical protein